MRANILIAWLGYRAPISLAISNFRYFLCVHTHVINQDEIKISKDQSTQTHQALRAMMDVAKMLVNKENVW
jgi:hypothetical protein